jgi:hypothetical protein
MKQRVAVAVQGLFLVGLAWSDQSLAADCGEPVAARRISSGRSGRGATKRVRNRATRW